MGAYFGVVFGLANEPQNCGAGFFVGGSGGGGKFERAIRQSESEAEGAVRTEFNFAPAKGYPGRRFGRAINDQLRVEIEPELARSGRLTSEWTRNTTTLLRPHLWTQLAGKRNDFTFEMLPGDKLGEFE